MSERPFENKKSINGLVRSATLHCGGRRPRSTTMQAGLKMNTPRNREAAIAHLSLLNEELSDTKRPTDPSTKRVCEHCHGTGMELLCADEKMEDSPQETLSDWVHPLPNVPQDEIDAHRAEVLLVEEYEKQRKWTARAKAAPEKSRGKSRSTNYEANNRHSANLSSDSERQSSPGRHRFDSMSIEDTSGKRTISPREIVVRNAVQIREEHRIMQDFVAGTTCDYSWTELHQCIHGGLSANSRERFWIIKSMTEDTCNLPSIDQILATARLPRNVYTDIMKDLYRTMPEVAATNPYFINSLYRGLVAHAALRPNIGYGQGMNMLWALIILSISKPHKQLVVAEYVLRTVLPYYFTTDNLMGAHIDALVLHYYLRRRCPVLEQTMIKAFSRGEWIPEGTEPSHLLSDMLLCITSSNFPSLFSHLLGTSQRQRLWDQIMLRGAVVIFEFVLRMLLYSYTEQMIANYNQWNEFWKSLLKRVSALDTIDVILDIHLPLGRIVQEDFVARRCTATRIMFARVNNAPFDRDPEELDPAPK